MAENIHGVLTKTLRQQLDPKLLDPTLHVLLSFGLGDSLTILLEFEVTVESFSESKPIDLP